MSTTNVKVIHVGGTKEATATETLRARLATYPDPTALPCFNEFVVSLQLGLTQRAIDMLAPQVLAALFALYQSRMGLHARRDEQPYHLAEVELIIDVINEVFFDVPQNKAASANVLHDVRKMMDKLLVAETGDTPPTKH